MGRFQPLSPIGEYTPLHLNALTSGSAFVGAGQAVNTTSATTITAGAGVVVTPASMSGIVVGKLLNIAGGTGTAENVRVSAVNLSAGTFSADFANNHSGAYSIVSRSPTYLGRLLINQPGSGVTITLRNGAPGLSDLPASAGVFAVIQPSAAGQVFEFACVCDHGLFYTVLSGTAGDYTLTYIDGVV
jgi:hypothetical protein